MRRIASGFTVLVSVLALSAVVSAGDPVPAAPAAPPAGAGAGQKVKFHRPNTRGQRFTMTLDMNIHSEGRMGDELGQSEDIAVAMVAKVQVMDVTAIGEPSAILVHLDKAQMTEKGAMKPMVVEGADLGITFQKGQPRFTARDGRKIPEAEQQMLSQVFEAPSGTAMDEWLGPGKEVKPGDSWPINKEIWAKVLSGPESDPKKPMNLDKMSGTVTFVAMEDWQGAPSQRLKSERTIQSAENPNFTGEAFTQFKEEYIFPVDPNSPKSDVTGEFLQRIKGKLVSKDGGMLDVKSQTKVTYHVVVQ